MTAASDHHTIAAMRTRHPIALGFLVHGITVHAITVQGITVLLTPSLLHASPSMSPRVPFQDALVAESVRATAPISEVTLYQGRAMIARTEASPAREGLFEMRFEKLPATIDPSTLQATVTSDRGGAKLLDVRYEEKVTQSDTSNNPELREAIAALEAAKRVGELNAMKMAAINDRYALLNAIRTKTATESAKDFGSKSLDPEALAKQIGPGRPDIRLDLAHVPREVAPLVVAVNEAIDRLEAGLQQLRRHVGRGAEQAHGAAVRALADEHAVARALLLN